MRAVGGVGARGARPILVARGGGATGTSGNRADAHRLEGLLELLGRGDVVDADRVRARLLGVLLDASGIATVSASRASVELRGGGVFLRLGLGLRLGGLGLPGLARILCGRGLGLALDRFAAVEAETCAIGQLLAALSCTSWDPPCNSRTPSR